MIPRMSIGSVLVLGLLVLVGSCFEQVHTKKKLLAFYQENSFKPILHTSYNKHFKNSPQFTQFESIIDELYADHGDYIEILFTDCDKDTDLQLPTCQTMNKTKDNRRVSGTFPSSQFKRLGDKIIQNPPFTHILQHGKDVYSYAELKDFISPLIPNFYKELNNDQQYQDFLFPRYSPKLIVFIKDDEELPIVLKEIAITYFLKMDFAYVTDLTQEIISKFQVKEYPSFVITKYNFNESKQQYFYFEKIDLSEDNYLKIKETVGKYVLKENRNDLVFHKVKMQFESQIITVQTEGELQQQKQKSNGWLIILRSDGKIPYKLAQLHQKYDRYFSYINFVHQPIGNMELYSPSQNITIPVPHGELTFNSLNAEQFTSNMTYWLHKGFVILGVVEDYSHVCGIAEKTFFKNTVKCLIVKKQQVDNLKQQTMKIDFKVGFIVAMQKKSNGKKQPKGVKIMQDNYEQIYQDLDYTTRIFIKDILDEYMENPISQIQYNLTLAEACSHPYKKCLFLITSLEKKDRTLQQYIKEVAFDYMNNVMLYEIDMDNNPQLITAIGGIKDKKADLIAYHPKTKQFTKLNKKVTKNLILQFLRANLKNDKRLKYIDGQILDSIIIKNKIQNEEKKEDIQQL